MAERDMRPYQALTANVWRARVLAVVVLVPAACAAPAPPALERPAPAPGRAPPQAPMAQVAVDECAIARCRPAFTFQLVEDNKSYVVKVSPAAYAGDGIAVYPGDDFFVTADEKNGVLENFRYVDPPRDAKSVIHIQFAQQARPNGRHEMVLTIQSFFSRGFVYHALTNHPARPPREYRETSTCPVGPMMRSIELWPNAISFMKLKDFRFVDRVGRCTYY